MATARVRLFACHAWPAPTSRTPNERCTLNERCTPNERCTLNERCTANERCTSCAQRPTPNTQRHRSALTKKNILPGHVDSGDPHAVLCSCFDGASATFGNLRQPLAASMSRTARGAQARACAPRPPPGHGAHAPTNARSSATASNRPQLQAFVHEALGQAGAALPPLDGASVLPAGPAGRLWMLVRQLAPGVAVAERALVPMAGTPAHAHWRATLAALAWREALPPPARSLPPRRPPLALL